MELEGVLVKNSGECYNVNELAFLETAQQTMLNAVLYMMFQQYRMEFHQLII